MPEVRRMLEDLETEVRHALLPLSDHLLKHEKTAVVSRVKECESALGALRRRQQGNLFDAGRVAPYSVMSLNELAAVRVLAFPGRRWTEVDTALRSRDPLKVWDSDPIRPTMARKCSLSSTTDIARSATIRAKL